MLMKMLSTVVMILVVLTANVAGVLGIRFIMDLKECFSHKAEYGSTIRFSFVVIMVEDPKDWRYVEYGIDLVVKGPNGEQISDYRGTVSVNYEFVAHNEGIYQFCFANKSPHQATIDFNVHSSNFYNDTEHAKDDHFGPVLEQISTLENALYSIQFEQRWLEAGADRQMILNERMNKRAMHKALVESVALIGASILQVYLLQRLFERKLGMSRV